MKNQKLLEGLGVVSAFFLLIDTAAMASGKVTPMNVWFAVATLAITGVAGGAVVLSRPRRPGQEARPSPRTGVDQSL